MIRLNQASDDQTVLRDALAQAEQALANPPPSDGTSEQKESYYDFTVAALVTAALELYRFEGEKRTIVQIFQQAAHQTVYLYSNRTRPEPHDRRSLWDYIRHLDVAVCFGKRLYSRFLVNLERWKYYYPPNPLLEATADFVDLLKTFIATGSLDQALADQLAVRLDGSKGSNLDRRYIAPQLGALRAIALRDENSVRLNLTQLLEFHALESLEGQYRLLPDAYICLPALRLAQLGAQAGLDCSVPSTYLPLDLLSPDGGGGGDTIND